MYANRRRKKRPNYGIRTVEVARGPNGFGFTISGQQPCILSCIVSNSPADLAGLRAGDFLISVNSVSVSKITHDAVVNLIGNSVGPIKMTIAENYYSDSSDEDIDMGRALNVRKPKYMHKPRIQRNYKHENRNVAFDRLLLESSNKKVSKLRECAINHLPIESRLNVNVYNEEAAGMSQNNNLSISNSAPTEEGISIEFKAIVGYLGTIEMPKQLQPNSRLQTVCSCIRKLRQEKRIPTAVLMTVLPTCLTLKNSSNHILAIYPTNRVVYISSANDKDSRYFGLVTSAVCYTRSIDNVQKQSESSFDNNWEDTDKKHNNFEERPDIAISNSCHVFMTDPKIVDHNVHFKKAENFKISCTTDIVTGNCLEFPKDALYIVSLVQNMYRLQSSESDISKGTYKNDINDEVIANSPQPSASSNSDSGIGFRDDCGNVSDRILVVEFPAHRHLPLISNNQNRPNNIAASNIPLEGLDLPLNNDPNYMNNVCCKNFDFKLNNNVEILNDETSLSNLNNIRACEYVSINIVETQESEYLNEEISNRLTVRAMPNPKYIMTRDISTQNVKCVTSDLGNAEVEAGSFFSERAIDVPDDSYCKKSYETMSLHSAGDEVINFKSSLDNVSVHSSKSLELNNIKTNFKTSKAKYLDNRKTNKKQLKMVSSCDDLIMDKYETSIMNYKLSPKVYGVSKPIYSCEQLNEFDAEKYGFGSLQDLSLWNTGIEKPTVAQSEPDVRIQRKSSNLSRDLKSNNNEDNYEKTASWATSFEKLLECNIGLHAFAEFLKKEFSAENIYFWTACERFKQLPPSQEKKNEAERIYQQHLCVGAIEAVNVDSQARHFAEHSLQEASNNTFEFAQKQIFNLMKFDSYPRFLKSELYKQCLSGNINDLEIDNSLLTHPISTGKLKKSLSNAEDRRRKSLLPWHRKNRAKSKDRGETEYNKKIDSCEMLIGNCDNSNDVHSSKSSLASLDFTNQDSAKGSNLDDSNNVKIPLCRVVMPSSGCTGTTVVKIKESETIQQLIDRLLEKRGLTFQTYDISTDKKLKDLDLTDSSMKLNGCQVFVEHKVCFKLDLPNRKIINIKSKPTKVLNDVVRQILLRYNYKIEDIIVVHDGNIVDLQQPVTLVENCKLYVQLKEYELKSMAAPQPLKIVNSKFHNLNEITNKVYEDILQEKAENACNKSKSDKSSVKSEDWGSEHSSGILGRFLRRDSGMQEKKKKLANKINSTNSSTEDVNVEHGNIIAKKPLIAKWKPGVRVQMAYSESDELYEGLSRAQRFRLEDQRGTEINFELPDFLKDKKQNPLTSGNTRKMRRQDERIFENSRFYTTDTIILPKQEKTPRHLKQEMHSNYENRTIMSTENNNVNIPNNNSYGQNNSAPHTKSSASKITATRKLSSSSDESSTSNQSTPTKNALEKTVIENFSRSNDSLNSNKSSEPPPLPPKPKILPIKPSNWGFKNETSPRKDSVKDGLYLEQPTSSFV